MLVLAKDKLIENIPSNCGYSHLEFEDDIKEELIFPAIDFISEKKHKIFVLPQVSYTMYKII